MFATNIQIFHFTQMKYTSKHCLGSDKTEEHIKVKFCLKLILPKCIKSYFFQFQLPVYMLLKSS